MSNYDIRHTDTNKATITVEADTELVAGLDVALFGRGFLEYGQELNENLLHLLENFACPEGISIVDSVAVLTGFPDFTVVSDGILTTPTEGQFWYNTTKKSLFQWNGTKWVKLASGSDYAANWGQLYHGQFLPRPVAANGYQFPYSECIWLVSPAGHAGRFDYHVCTTTNDAKVFMKYHLIGSGNIVTFGIVNYIIIGIKGNINSGVNTYNTPGTVPDYLFVAPTPSPNASQPPTPTPTRTPSPTPAPGASPTPTQTTTPTPTPTPTVTPTPSRSPIPGMDVTVYDSARGGAISDMLAICRKEDHIPPASLDYGNLGCSGSLGMCASGECAPEPGTYAGGGNVAGPELGVTVSGGVAPYNIVIRNVTKTSGTLPAGECLYFGNSAGFNTFGPGIVNSSTIAVSGGSKNVGGINASCGSENYTIDGTFELHITDTASHVFNRTIPYSVVRSGDVPCYSVPYFYTGFMYTSSNGGSSSCDGFANSGTPAYWLGMSAAGDEWVTTFTRLIGSDRRVPIGGVDRYYPRPAARVTVNIGATPVTVTTYSNGQYSGANGNFTNSQSVTIGTITYTVTLAIAVTYDHTQQISGDCNNILYYHVAPTVTVTPGIINCSSRPAGTPDPEAPVGGGGGGGGGGCVTCDSAIYGGFDRADEVNVGDSMTVINPVTYELGYGDVSYSKTEMQPCVRIETASGVVLECSTTAPIADEYGTPVLAPDLLGVRVPVFENGMISIDEVVSVSDIGMKAVRFITVENNYFLAGQTDGRFLLHHNIKVIN